VPYSRALTVQIPSDAVTPGNTQTTPLGRPTPSPLPLLTPALPTPPMATVATSTRGNAEEGSSGPRPPGPAGQADIGTSGRTESGAALWGAWGDWDLRSPSADVPRTPVPHLPGGVPPMALGAPGGEPVLRRRNTPFDLRWGWPCGFCLFCSCISVCLREWVVCGFCLFARAVPRAAYSVRARVGVLVAFGMREGRVRNMCAIAERGVGETSECTITARIA
jgi:hypothetical protein